MPDFKERLAARSQRIVESFGLAAIAPAASGVGLTEYLLRDDLPGIVRLGLVALGGYGAHKGFYHYIDMHPVVTYDEEGYGNFVLVANQRHGTTHTESMPQ